MTHPSCELAESAKLEPAVRRVFKDSGQIPYRRKLPESEKLIKPHSNNIFRHAGVSLVEIRNVHMWTNNSIICIYDGYDGVYESLTMQHKPMDWDAAICTPIVDVPDTTVLFPHLDPHNYYHWLIDTIPCFGVLDMAGIDIGTMDNLYIHRMKGEYQWQMLEMMEVDADKLMYQKTIEPCHYNFERMLIPDFRLYGGGWPHPWLVEYLRAQFSSLGTRSAICGKNQESDKLYIARGDARRTIINEEALINELELLGYRILRPDNASFLGQVGAMRDVRLVLASHGAGLANIVFSEPETKVIEFGGHYITEHFRLISEACKADYRVFAAGLDESGNPLPISNKEEIRDRSFIADINKIVDRAEAFYKYEAPAVVRA